jgi:uncharacterized phage infection (PIP) family protein YhgE
MKKLLLITTMLLAATYPAFAIDEAPADVNPSPLAATMQSVVAHEKAKVEALENLAGMLPQLLMRLEAQQKELTALKETSSTQHEAFQRLETILETERTQHKEELQKLKEEMTTQLAEQQKELAALKETVSTQQNTIQSLETTLEAARTQNKEEMITQLAEQRKQLMEEMQKISEESRITLEQRYTDSEQLRASQHGDLVKAIKMLYGAARWHNKIREEKFIENLK